MKSTIATALILFTFPAFLFAEGTKQLRKTSSEKSSIQLYDRSDGTGPLRKFATYEADSNERLYFTILDFRTEVVMVGFKMDQYKDSIYFRIKDSQGNIVSAPRKLPKAGAGYISNYTNAINGPNHPPEINAPLGYAPLLFHPTSNGDFYIEFNVGHPTTINPVDSLKIKHIFDFFDLTVIDKNNHSAIEGRVWSRAWDFTTQAGNNIFTANLFIYADDGIVTKVDFNGMMPHGFVVSSNQTGTKNTGTPFENRQSLDGNFTYPQYKIFLTYPDPLAFKPGEVGILLTSPNLKCNGNNFCFNLTTTSSGYAELLLELNGQPGYQPDSKDVLLGQSITAAGETCLLWDGKNGLGEKINPLVPMMAIATFQKGLTHLPLYDVEGHPNGYIVEMVVPEKKLLQLYWDDSNIINGSVETNGCLADSLNNKGCHGWALTKTGTVNAIEPIDSFYFGNNRTVNTWWYATLQTDTLYPKLPELFATTITSDHEINIDSALICENKSIRLIPKLSDENKNYQYKWFNETGTFSSTDKSPYINGLTKDTYLTLQIVNPENNCFASSHYFIKVRNIFVPNLITPNGDDHNETFVIQNLFTGSVMQIFNRWGDRVFENSNYANEWNAKDLGDGVYYYKLESGGSCGVFQGWVEVKR